MHKLGPGTGSSSNGKLFHRPHLSSCPGAQILASLEDLLLPGVNNQMIAPDDIVFLYEAAAILILTVDTDDEVSC